jgi:putative ABC transport system permease protein
MIPVRLVIKNLSRNRRRTFLTAGSVAVSIFLITIFCATYRYISAPAAPSGFSLLLIVTRRTSLTVPLPLSYRDRIARLPGVDAVTPVNMVDARYGGQDTLLWALACDPETLDSIFTDWRLTDADRQAFRHEKVALIAGRKTAEKFHWKRGDLINLRSPGYGVNPNLILRGIYTSPDDESLLMFHWDYLNEVLGRPNTPGGFWLRARTPEDIPRLMREIDALFHNTAAETRTQPMKQLVLDMLAMLGNIKLILVGISAAVLFAVLLIMANSMAMSIRERTGELAILRALGFRTGQLLGMLTAESLVIALAGTAVGCGAGALALAATAGYQMGGAMPVYIRADAPTLGVALGVAVFINLVSTLLPAWRASRISIAEALRFVG